MTDPLEDAFTCIKPSTKPEMPPEGECLCEDRIQQMQTKSPNISGVIWVAKSRPLSIPQNHKPVVGSPIACPFGRKHEFRARAADSYMARETPIPITTSDAVVMESPSRVISHHLMSAVFLTLIAIGCNVRLTG
jgi:hypothetical protein